MAKKLGLTDEDSETIFYASPMHDIGKVGIPSDILLKPAKVESRGIRLDEDSYINRRKKKLRGSVSQVPADGRKDRFNTS